MAAKKIVTLSTEDLKLNQLVEIEVDDGGFKGRYPSRIEEAGEKTLVLAMPMHRGEIVPLHPGLRIQVSFTREGAGYVFSTNIINRVRTPLPIMIVEKPVEAERSQRRSWVRVDINLPIKFRVWPTDVKGHENKGYENLSDYIETTTIDISGGGLMLLTDELLKQGDLLEIVLEAAGIGPLKIKSKVMQIRSTPPSAKKGYFIGVIFIDIREGERDRIVRMVFNRQRELIKRGLLNSH
jgi:c-di-GMP-binding flagellar brake protein YcgR